MSQKLVRTSVQLPIDVLKYAKVIAKSHDMTISQALRFMLRQLIDLLTQLETHGIKVIEVEHIVSLELPK